MVFEHILWMFVCLRLLGSEPAAPCVGMTLFAYAAELEIQYCRLWISAGAAASSEARELDAAERQIVLDPHHASYPGGKRGAMTLKLLPFWWSCPGEGRKLKPG